MSLTQKINWAKFTRFRGDAKRLRFMLRDDLGRVVNPTGKTLLFSIKADLDDEDEDALVQKSSLVGGFTIVDAATGAIDVSLLAEDDTALAVGPTYQVDVKAESEDFPFQTVGRGTLVLTKQVTRERTLSIETVVTQPESIAGDLNAATASAAAAAALAEEKAQETSDAATAAAASAALAGDNAANAVTAAGAAATEAASAASEADDAETSAAAALAAAQTAQAAADLVGGVTVQSSDDESTTLLVIDNLIAAEDDESVGLVANN